MRRTSTRGFTPQPYRYAQSDERSRTFVMRHRPNGEERTAQRRRVRTLIAPYRWWLAALTTLSFMSGSVEALFLVVVTRTALSIADGREITGLVAAIDVSINWALVIAVLLLVVKLSLALLAVAVSVRFSEKVSTDLRRELSESFLSASWATQQDEPSGRLQQLVTGFTGNAAGVVGAVSSTISAALNLFALLVFAVAIDPVASIIVVFALLALGSVLGPIRARIRIKARASSRAQMEYSRSLSELGELGLEMQTFGVRSRFSEMIDEQSDLVSRTSRESGTLRGSLPHVYTTLAYGALVFGLIVAASVGVRELSAIGAVMLVMLRALSYSQQLQSSSASLAGGMPFLEELDNTRDRYRANSAPMGSIPLSDMGTIEFRSVSFGYSKDRPALTEVSFEIRRGEIVGVIGPSGAGKSTLVQLLLGLREPTSGEIIVDGVLLQDVERIAWTGLTSFVPQDPHLFTGTITDNIRFFRNNIDIKAVREASVEANVLRDIEALPEGFDTHIGERGVKLSGGQRQRISIARALAGRPALLVLDEPTSALDVHSEALIRETVAALGGDVTVVIIAHRMSTLDMCDRIMVIEGGRVMAFDTPDKLRADSEFYRQSLSLSGIS